ncbi:uncharacterized protein LOC110443141 [Mizuhopecten yessoensis]|uniref:Uncharacterized protein n=1 Tax=Mizuhopecten yessoensis TaxID=6573 RepID=A0A210PFI0_MIZYE|nr:uncharacterized protein LOC110443141 [Mizuhopecten yessoensis]OWF35253.1 hypothetical protein KP79_PYT14992 [Mizuhopecten yessoensis]
MNGNYNAWQDHRSESFVVQALSQVSLMAFQDVEEFGQPVSAHDISANTDVSRPTDPESMGRRHPLLDSEGEDEDDEGEIIITSLQLDMSELTASDHLARVALEEEEVTISVDIERKVSLRHFGLNVQENTGGFALPRAASHSGVSRTNSMQRLRDIFSWKGRTKSDTSTPGALPTLDEEGSKPAPEKRSDRKGIFGRRKQQNRNRQPETQQTAPNVNLTGGEAPVMTQKVFQTYFHNAVEGRTYVPPVNEDDTIDFSSYIL